MSKGSPIVPIRINRALLHCLDKEIARVNLRRKAEPYTRSSFILYALNVKLRHLFRSRKDGRKPKKKLPAPLTPSQHEP